MLLAVEPVHHLVAVRHLAAVVHGGALLLGAGVGVSLLHLLLDLVAGIAARRRSGHRAQGRAAGARNPFGAATSLRQWAVRSQAALAEDGRRYRGTPVTRRCREA